MEFKNLEKSVAKNTKAVSRRMVKNAKTAETAVESLWKNAATEVKYGGIAVIVTLTIIAVVSYLINRKR